MPILLKSILIATSSLLFIIIWGLISRKRLALRYSLLWLITSFCLIFIAAVPHTIIWISALLGFEISSNFIFSIIIGFLVLICISYSICVTTLNRKIDVLAQHIAIDVKGAVDTQCKPDNPGDCKVLVIIPAYNESANICRTVKDLKNCAPFVDYLIVNDGSVDGTAAVCEENGLNYISLPINLGIGCAVQSGYKYSKKHGYDVAIQFDGDGQHDASYISLLVEEIQNGHDLVVGSRFINKEGFQSSKIRQLGINWLRLVIRLLFGIKVTDPTSGFRACNKRLIDTFAYNYPNDYPEPETVAVALLNKYRYLEVPVTMNERIGGESSIKRLKSLYYMIKVTLAIVNVRIQKRNRQTMP